MKSRKCRRPGPFPAGALPWVEKDSFFAPKVQAVLLRRQDILGWPIRCWETVEAITRRFNPKQDHGYRPWIQFNNKQQEQQFLCNRWINFANCYNADRDLVAELFAVMTSFHALPPKDWPLPRKLSCLSNLAEYEGDDHLPKANQLLPKPAPPLRHIRMAKILEEWFGNKIEPDRIRVELTRERKRRLDVHIKWNKHYEHLNQQIEAQLTATRTSKKL